MPGLSTLGTVRAPGTDGAFGIYDYRAGAGAIVLTIGGPGFKSLYISTIAATAAGAGATIQIDAGNAVPVPAGGSVSLDIDCTLFCNSILSHTITFVGTSSYLVDWFQLGV